MQERSLNWVTGRGRDLLSESRRVVELLRAKLGGHLIEAAVENGAAVVMVKPGALVDFCRVLKLDAELGFDFLVDITAVDWLDKKEKRFEVVYHLLSLAHGYRLRIKSPLAEEEPEIDSLVSLWPSANFLEREVWDMFGVRFKGHPDLRRILMYEEFKGHPLRKDYPLQGKQPRVKLRYPEVQNTALLMQRPELVQINRREKRT